MLLSWNKLAHCNGNFALSSVCSMMDVDCCLLCAGWADVIIIFFAMLPMSCKSWMDSSWQPTVLLASHITNLSLCFHKIPGNAMTKQKRLSKKAAHFCFKKALFFYDYIITLVQSHLSHILPLCDWIIKHFVAGRGRINQSFRWHIRGTKGTF